MWRVVVEGGNTVEEVVRPERVAAALYRAQGEAGLGVRRHVEEIFEPTVKPPISGFTSMKPSLLPSRCARTLDYGQCARRPFRRALI